MFENIKSDYRSRECILINDDCLKAMKDIPDKSINLILCDLPYGKIGCKWDKVLNMKALWEQYERIITDDGNIVLFASGVFTFDLIESNRKLLKYKYVWIKNTTTGFVHAKNKPLSKHEDILIYSKRSVGHVSQLKEKRMIYNPQGLIKSNKKVKNAKDKFGEYMRKRPSHKSEYVQEYTNYPTDILYFNVPSKKLHTSEKPLDLLDLLVNTFSNENSVILDNCMGSGSCGLSAIRNNRFFIGIEIDKKIFDISKERIQEFPLK